MSIFDSCKLESSFDEMFDAQCNVRPHWNEIKNGLDNAGIKQLEQKQQKLIGDLKITGLLIIFIMILKEIIEDGI
jgi:uncharacterized circularly permuted ATP-grasp superfamily protein